MQKLLRVLPVLAMLCLTSVALPGCAAWTHFAGGEEAESLSPKARAEALGIEYAALQSMAISYLKNANPGQGTKDAIYTADKVASGYVQDVLRQSLVVEDATSAVENAETSEAEATAKEAVAAQTSAFETMLSVAHKSFAALAGLISGG